jgi:hypothetical protein
MAAILGLKPYAVALILSFAVYSTKVRQAGRGMGRSPGENCLALSSARSELE